MTIHTFTDTGAAYDACQCDERIKDGDILLIEEERVIGIAGTWPVAITAETGELHAANPGRLLVALTNLEMDADLSTAISLAQDYGFDLRGELS